MTPQTPTPSVRLSEFLSIGGLNSLNTFQSNTLDATVLEVENLRKKVDELTEKNKMLVEQNVYMRGQLDGMRHTVDRFVTEKSSMSANTSSTASVPNNTPLNLNGPTKEHVTYVPSDRVKFPNVKFWKRADFKNGTSSADAITVEEVNLDQAEDAGSNKQQRFLEDENGDVISGEQATDIRQWAFDLFGDLHKKKMAPTLWVAGAGAELKMWFYACMSQRYLLVGYCEDNWKAEELAKQQYPQWLKQGDRKVSIQGDGKLKRKRVMKPKVEADTKQDNVLAQVASTTEGDIGKMGVVTEQEREPDVDNVPTKKPRPATPSKPEATSTPCATAHEIIPQAITETTSSVTLGTAGIHASSAADSASSTPTNPPVIEPPRQTQEIPVVKNTLFGRARPITASVLEQVVTRSETPTTNGQPEAGGPEKLTSNTSAETIGEADKALATSTESTPSTAANTVALGSDGVKVHSRWKPKLNGPPTARILCAINWSRREENKHKLARDFNSYWSEVVLPDKDLQNVWQKKLEEYNNPVTTGTVNSTGGNTAKVV
ncbi:hypothetical protein AAF712_015358 [Marasmius tenuissimus]|uniref:Uncharacterized protein n=1 Tax=Marasmius tenuissimus TaxID=585030 RepID=A0ABR2Z9G3_9AGAR